MKKIKYSNTKRRNIFKRIITYLDMRVPIYYGQDFLVVFDWFMLVHLGLRGLLCWWWWDKTQKVNWLGNKSEHKSTFTLAFWDKITKKCPVQSLTIQISLLSVFEVQCSLWIFNDSRFRITQMNWTKTSITSYCAFYYYSPVRVVVVSNRMDWTFLRMKTFIDQILTIWVVRVR